MPATIVQSKVGIGTTASVGVTLTDATPTPGNTLVAIMAADAYATAAPTAGTGRAYGTPARVTSENNLGFYVWTRLVQSGDSATTTFSLGAASSACIVAEVSGTFDLAGAVATTNNSSSGSQTAPGLVPGDAADLVLAIIGVTSTNTVLSGPSANNGFVIAISAINPSSGGGKANAFVATKSPGSTANTGTTTISYSGLASDRSGAQVALTPLAGGGESHSGSPALSGSGTLTVILQVNLTGLAALTGTGSLTAAANPATSSSTALSGSGALAAAADPAARADVALTGAGSLTAAADPAAAAAVTLSGAGSLDASPQPATATTAALSGSGDLSATATPAAAAGPALTGSGALSAVPAGGSSDTAALSGAGALAAVATPKPSGVASLAGDGTLTTTHVPGPAAAVALTGSGTLASVAGNDFAAAAGLSGSGQLTATRTPALAGVATLTGSGALTTTWLPAGVGSAALSGSGTLAASGYNPGAARDITVTGSLGTRWTGALGATTRPTAALATRWKGTLT